MQLERIDRSVSTGGVQTTGKSRIIMDGVAFKILSDGLYSNKIGSMVRETFSNGFDSHISAGKADVPVSVTLPTALAPVFKVKDQGIGMSLEQVQTALDYFSSTKRADNDNIGGFGLGFKSPYAYSDQFTVVSTYNGKRYTVSAYMDENGEPGSALLSVENTDESNGVEVAVPVNATDIYEFTREVGAQLRYFNPRPAITGAPDFEWPEAPSNAIKIDGVGEVYSTQGWGDKIKAMIGPVAFPVSMNELGDLPSEDLSSFCRRLKARLVFNVGEIMPLPSREGLQYTEATKKAIVAKLAALHKGVSDYLSVGIEACETRYDAIRAKAQALRILPTFRDIIEKISWREEAIGTSLSVKAPAGSLGETFLWANVNPSDRIAFAGGDYRRTVPLNRDLYIFVDDFEGKSFRQGARIRKFLDDNSLTGVDVLAFRACQPSDYPDFNGFPKDRIFYLSKLEAPESAAKSYRRSRSSAGLPPVRRAKRGMWGTSSTSKSCLESCSDLVENPPNEGMYVISDNHCVSSEVSKKIRCEQLFPGDVYIIPKSLKSMVEKNDKWISFEEVFDAHLKKSMPELRKRSKALGKAHGFLSGINTPMTGMFNKMRRLDIKPKASPNPVWKLYSRYLTESELGNEKEPFLAFQETSKIYDKAWSLNREETKSLVKELAESNKLLHVVLDRAYYHPSFNGLVPSIVKKIF